MKGFLSTYLWAIVFGFGLKFFGGVSLKDYRLWIFMFAMVFSVGLAKNQAKDEGYREAKEECRKSRNLFFNAFQGKRYLISKHFVKKGG